MSKRELVRFIDRPGSVAVILLLGVFCIVAGLRELGYLQQLELEAYDLFIVLHPREEGLDSPIVLVEITEADIQELGRWPLTDAMLAELLQRLSAQEPRVIGVDIYRDRYISPGTGDLEQILAQSHNIFVVEKFGTGRELAIAPPPILQGTDRAGFSDIVVDSDGVVRRGLLFLDDGESFYYALSLRLALKYLASQGVTARPGADDPRHLRLGDVTLRPFEPHDGPYVGADARGYQYLLDYRDQTERFPRLSFADVMVGSIESGLLEGKIVIVGVVAEGVKDYFLAPWSKQEARASDLSGIALHATMTSQLLRAALAGDQPLSIIDDRLEYAWILAWTIGGLFAGLVVRSLLWFLFATGIGLAAQVLINFTAFVSGWWLPLVPAAAGWLICAALMAAYMSSYENRQRRQVMALFSAHVSEDVAREIWQQRDRFVDGGRLEARKSVATVLFSDLADSTPVTESLDPIALMGWLNRYTERMTELVMEHGGMVDDYYGDAIKANFGVLPIRTSDAEIGNDARNAVRCALAMRDEIRRVNLELEDSGLPSMRMRIGVCTGPVVTGCIGSARRMKFTTIGDTVNTASRLENYGKEVAGDDSNGRICRIMVAESTARYLDEDVATRYLGRVPLKGKSEVVEVYGVVWRPA